MQHVYFVTNRMLKQTTVSAAIIYITSINSVRNSFKYLQCLVVADSSFMKIFYSVKRIAYFRAECAQRLLAFCRQWIFELTTNYLYIICLHIVLLCRQLMLTTGKRLLVYDDPTLMKTDRSADKNSSVCASVNQTTDVASNCRLQFCNIAASQVYCMGVACQQRIVVHPAPLGGSLWKWKVELSI